MQDTKNGARSGFEHPISKNNVLRTNADGCRGGVARKANEGSEMDKGRTQERKARVMRTLHTGEGDLGEDVIDELVHTFRHCRPDTLLLQLC